MAPGDQCQRRATEPAVRQAVVEDPFPEGRRHSEPAAAGQRAASAGDANEGREAGEPEAGRASSSPEAEDAGLGQAEAPVPENEAEVEAQAWANVEEKILDGLVDSPIDGTQLADWVATMMVLFEAATGKAADYVVGLVKQGFPDMRTLALAGPARWTQALEKVGMVNEEQLDLMRQELVTVRTANTGLGAWIQERVPEVCRGLEPRTAARLIKRYVDSLRDAGCHNVASLVTLNEARLTAVLKAAGFLEKQLNRLAKELQALRNGPLAGEVARKVMLLGPHTFLALSGVVARDTEEVNAQCKVGLVKLRDGNDQCYVINTTVHIRKEVTQWIVPGEAAGPRMWQLQLTPEQGQVVAVPAFVDFRPRDEVLLSFRGVSIRRHEWKDYLSKPSAYPLWEGDVELDVILTTGGATLKGGMEDSNIDSDTLRGETVSLAHSWVHSLTLGIQRPIAKVRFLAHNRKLRYELRALGRQPACVEGCESRLDDLLNSLYEKVKELPDRSGGEDGVWSGCRFEGRDLQGLKLRDAVAENSTVSLAPMRDSLILDNHVMWAIILELEDALLERDGEFFVRVDGRAADVGVEFCKLRQCLIVRRISDGLIKAWNDEHADFQICEGDAIIEANGQCHDADLLAEECEIAQELTLKVRKAFERTLTTAVVFRPPSMEPPAVSPVQRGTWNSERRTSARSSRNVSPERRMSGRPSHLELSPEPRTSLQSSHHVVPPLPTAEHRGSARHSHSIVPTLSSPEHRASARLSSSVGPTLSSPEHRMSAVSSLPIPKRSSQEARVSRTASLALPRGPSPERRATGRPSLAAPPPEPAAPEGRLSARSSQVVAPPGPGQERRQSARSTAAGAPTPDGHRMSTRLSYAMPRALHEQGYAMTHVDMMAAALKRVDANRRLMSCVQDRDLGEVKEVLPQVYNLEALCEGLRRACFGQWSWRVREEKVDRRLKVLAHEEALRAALLQGDLDAVHREVEVAVKVGSQWEIEQAIDISVPALADGDLGLLLEDGPLRVVGFRTPRAQQSDWRRGDVIEQMNGATVSTLADLAEALEREADALPLTVRVRRRLSVTDASLFEKAEQVTRVARLEAMLRARIAERQEEPLREALRLAHDSGRPLPDAALIHEAQWHLSVVVCERELQEAIDDLNVALLHTGIRRAEKLTGVDEALVKHARDLLRAIEGAARRRRVLAQAKWREATIRVRHSLRRASMPAGGIKEAAAAAALEVAPAAQQSLTPEQLGVCEVIIRERRERRQLSLAHRRWRCHLAPVKHARKILAKMAEPPPEPTDEWPSANGEEALEQKPPSREPRAKPRLGPLRLQQRDVAICATPKSQPQPQLRALLRSKTRPMSIRKAVVEAPVAEPAGANAEASTAAASSEEEDDEKPDIAELLRLYRMDSPEAAEWDSEATAKQAEWELRSRLAKLVAGEAASQVSLQSETDFLTAVCSDLVELELALQGPPPAEADVSATMPFAPFARVQAHNLSQQSQTSVPWMSSTSFANTSSMFFGRQAMTAGSKSSVWSTQWSTQTQSREWQWPLDGMLVQEEERSALPSFRPMMGPRTPRGPPTLAPMPPRSPPSARSTDAAAVAGAGLAFSRHSPPAPPAPPPVESAEPGWEDARHVKAGEPCVLDLTLWPSKAAEVRGAFAEDGAPAPSAVVALVPAWKSPGPCQHAELMGAALAIAEVPGLWGVKERHDAEVVLAVPDVSLREARRIRRCEFRLYAVERRSVHCGPVAAATDEAGSPGSPGRRARFGSAPPAAVAATGRDEEPPRAKPQSSGRCLMVGPPLRCHLVRPPTLQDLHVALCGGPLGVAAGSPLRSSPLRSLSAQGLGRTLRLETVVTVERALLPRVRLQLACGAGARLHEEDLPPLCTKRPWVANARSGVALGSSRERCDQFVPPGRHPVLQFDAVGGCYEYLIQCSAAPGKAAGGALARAPGAGGEQSTCYVAKSSSASPDAAGVVSFELAGLRSGRYRCSVRARNKNGFGVWSRPSRAFLVLPDSRVDDQRLFLEHAMDSGDPETLAAALADVARFPLVDLESPRMQEAKRQLDRLKKARDCEVKMRATICFVGGDRAKALSQVIRQVATLRHLIDPKLLKVAQQMTDDYQEEVNGRMQRAVDAGDVLSLLEALEDAEGATPGCDPALLRKARARLAALVCEKRLAFAVERDDEEGVVAALQKAQETADPEVVQHAQRDLQTLRLKHMRKKVEEAVRGTDEEALHAVLREAGTAEIEPGPALQTLKEGAALRIEAIQCERDLNAALASRDLEQLRGAMQHLLELQGRADHCAKKVQGFRLVDEMVRMRAIDEIEWQEQEGRLRDALAEGNADDMLTELEQAQELRCDSNQAVFQEVRAWLQKQPGNSSATSALIAGSGPELLLGAAMVVQSAETLQRLVKQLAGVLSPEILQQAQDHLALLQRDEQVRQAYAQRNIDALRMLYKEGGSRGLDTELHKEVSRFLLRTEYEDQLFRAESAARTWIKEGDDQDESAEDRLRVLLRQSTMIPGVPNELLSSAMQVLGVCEHKKYTGRLHRAIEAADRSALEDLYLRDAASGLHLLDIQTEAGKHLSRLRLEDAMMSKDVDTVESALQYAYGVCDEALVSAGQRLLVLLRCKQKLTQGVENSDEPQLELGLKEAKRLEKEDPGLVDGELPDLVVRARIRLKELRLLWQLASEDLADLQAAVERAQRDDDISEHWKRRAELRLEAIMLGRTIRRAQEEGSLVELKQLLQQAEELEADVGDPHREGLAFLAVACEEELTRTADLAASSRPGTAGKPEDALSLERSSEPAIDEQLADALELAKGIEGVRQILIDRSSAAAARLVHEQIRAAFQVARNAQEFTLALRRADRLAEIGVRGLSTDLIDAARVTQNAWKCYQELHDIIGRCRRSPFAGSANNANKLGLQKALANAQQGSVEGVEERAKSELAKLVKDGEAMLHDMERSAAQAAARIQAGRPRS